MNKKNAFRKKFNELKIEKFIRTFNLILFLSKIDVFYVVNSIKRFMTISIIILLKKKF